jgi:hypothetical protein
MTSVRKFEQEIWRSLAVYVNRGDTAALIEQEDAASRYGGMTLVDR